MAQNGFAYERILRQTRLTALLLRCGGLFLLSLIYLVQPSHTVTGLLVFGTLAVWTGYRLIRHRYNAYETWIDWLLAATVAANYTDLLGDLPALTADSPALSVVGTTVLAMTIELRWWASLLATAGMIVAFAYGAMTVETVSAPWEISWLYYFASQWVVVAAVRVLVERAARTADEAATEYALARAIASTDRARRQLQREHWATLHDTAAATLTMVGAGASVSAEHLRRQATRDIDALQNLPSLVAPGVTDLRSAVRLVADQSPLQITVRGGHDVAVSTPVAAALVGAVRESLNNVERHSGAGAATLMLSESAVIVEDTGRGFDEASTRPDVRPGHGRGVRESIHARMTEVGGSATIRSALGTGTRVELSWTPPPEVDQADTDAVRRASRISRIFNYGMVVVATIYPAMAFATALGTGTLDLPVQLALAAVVVAVIALGAYGLLVRTPALWLTITGLAAVSAVVLIQPLTADAWVGDGATWAAGFLGFPVLLLALRWKLGGVALALVLCWLPNLVAAAVKGQFVDPSIISLLSIAVSNVGAQILVGSWILALRVNATLAAADGVAMAKVLEAETIAQEVQEDHRQRYLALVETTVPLLRALADGTADVDTPGVRERAAIESARLRRLFADSDQAGRPFAQSLLAVVTEYESRGLTISLDIDDAVRQPDADNAAAILGAVDEVLRITGSFAKIVVTEEPDLELSVVCDATAAPDPNPVTPSGLQTRQDWDADTLWIQITVPTAPDAAQVDQSEGDLLVER